MNNLHFFWHGVYISQLTYDYSYPSLGKSQLAV